MRSSPQQKRASKSVEWVGGIVRPRERTPDDFEEGILFLMPGNRVGLSMVPEGDGLCTAVESLTYALRQRPLHAPAPTSIRVASHALAATLQAAYPRIEMVVAPTPEITQRYGYAWAVVDA